MSDKKIDDIYPDLSGIFDIDDSDVPKTPIKRPDEKRNSFLTDRSKHTDNRKKSGSDQRILTADLPDRKLSREELAERRRKKREQEIRIAKTRLIILLSAILIVIIAAIGIKTAVANSKMPVADIARASVEKMDRTYEARAAILKNPLGTNAVLIDNDYDVHHLEKNQYAEVRKTEGPLFKGTVEKIQEEDRESDYFKKIAALLLKEQPETSVYSVYITIDDPDDKLSDGDTVDVKILTKTVDKALSVPSSAVYTNSNQPYVWKYHSVKKVILKQEVTTGITADGKTEITAGLEKGDLVISEISCSEDDLYNGMKIKTK